MRSPPRSGSWGADGGTEPRALCALRCAAGDWVKEALAVLGGKGGGKPTSAQVGNGGGGGMLWRKWGSGVAKHPTQCPYLFSSPPKAAGTWQIAASPPHTCVQGMGPAVDKVDDAAAAATALANLKL